MKNLESFGVQELNAEEIRETDGGVTIGTIGALMEGWYNGIIAAHSFMHGFAEEFISQAERVIKASS